MTRTESKREIRDQISQRALGQHGAICIPQMVESGMSRSEVHREIEAGRWRELPSSVLVAASQPLTAMTRCSAAVLMVRPDGALARQSALALHGLTLFPSLVHVVTRHRRRYRIPHDVVVHRTRELPDSDLCVLDGIRATTIERALVDSAPTCTRTHLSMLIDEAIRTGATSAERIIVRAMELRRFGRKGPKEVIELASLRPVAAGTQRSALEVFVGRTIESWGLPRPSFNEKVATSRRTYECDFVWRAEKVILECDSRIHDLEDQRQFDEQKDEALEEAGWSVKRIRLGDLTRRPAGVRRWLVRALGT